MGIKRSRIGSTESQKTHKKGGWVSQKKKQEPNKKKTALLVNFFNNLNGAADQRGLNNQQQSPRDGSTVRVKLNNTNFLPQGSFVIDQWERKIEAGIRIVGPITSARLPSDAALANRRAENGSHDQGGRDMAGNLGT